MLGVLVEVPIACWRKGHAREYLETEVIPPPSTCYGFLLALVGEEDRKRHQGARVTAGLVQRGEVSAVLRTLWRVKTKAPPGVGSNARPDWQQLATGTLLTIWVDDGDEVPSESLETRVKAALAHPDTIDRFGGLSLGESTHLVNQVSVIAGEPPQSDVFCCAPTGRLSLPVWVDHVGSAGTRHVVGDLVTCQRPDPERLPLITPPTP
jgi:CRISPR-associated protein Cas5t